MGASAGERHDHGEHGHLFSHAVEWINQQPRFFDASKPLCVARAPGRMDVMGGFGDYSGSRVLEFPIAQATWVVAQETDQPALVVRSTRAAETGGASEIVIPLAELTPAGGPLQFADARVLLTATTTRAWAAYVAGVAVVLHRLCGQPLRTGVNLLIHSDVPVGKGLSSSAALEVATLEVLAHMLNLSIDERRAAVMAQQVENLIVGAPCGVMDQMTSLSGKRDHLTEILCQPAELCGHVPLPSDLELWAIDSGIRHAVSGSDYSTVRAATFMGYRIVADIAGLRATIDGDRRAHIDDPMFGGYLANVTPALWRARFRSQVPEFMDGRAFLARYGGSTDVVTTIEPDRTYAVRACAEHPILENERVRRFRDVLLSGATTAESRLLLGTLMAASHASYSACGLGSPGTDLLVELVHQVGAERDGPSGRDLYGAKITGGGSGGTIVVLARDGSRAAIQTVAARYQGACGLHADILTGSSAGARRVGVHRLVPDPRGPVPG